MTVNAPSDEAERQSLRLPRICIHTTVAVGMVMLCATALAQGASHGGSSAPTPAPPVIASPGTAASAPTAVLPAAAASAPKPEGSLEVIGRIWTENKLTEKVLGVAALALGIWLTKLRSKLTKVRESLDRLRVGFSVLRSGMPVTAENRYLKVCMLGLGGAGKTTLVRTFTQCPDADPAAVTGDLRKFITLNEYAGPKTRFGVRIDWYDYAGQNPAQLTVHTRADAEPDDDDERPNDNHKNYDAEPFDAIILILDLFDPPDAGSTYTTTFPNWNNARLNTCIKQWSPTAVSAVKGALGDRIQYVCIFVNKFNLLSLPTEAIRDEIRRKVQPYVNTIAPIFRSAEIDFVVGSALGDAHTVTIRQKLHKYGRELNGS